MSQIDNWPQAPILTKLPAVARLRQEYDADRLRKDLAQLNGLTWNQPRIVSGEGVGKYVTDLDWRSIALRSLRGEATRSDAGGPGLAEFADTRWLADTPYFKEVLAGIPAPLRAVRLMLLGPGAESPLHHDTKYGLPWGALRLHVPVLTTPGAVLEIDDTTQRWQPGQLWYADFTRMHVVRNTDREPRVHMVIDCQPTEELLELFPREFHTADVRRNILFASEQPTLSIEELAALRCTFRLPRSFKSFEEEDGVFTVAQECEIATIDLFEDSLGLHIDGQAAFKLVHVGDREFRLAGWSRERTIQLIPSEKNGGDKVILRSRCGNVVRSLEIPSSRPL
ncbi:aspartyl/asparaginyl beta-hydroxylase domain-containing protein [Streptomyces sp. NBC_01750]|uniref:aspartyl/asparaginyl beta-hydroxylase domain-containing protein n=1 Tax=Streptomyces sp. NBC_01750 TaxID=2975928 RepID=UPI002DD808E2|nr:aspartyl/asparaginyl beta-hydroxylase domain-containing protein [Streptomyces sp. NBC_01750]WSD30519.1 aspartyl/asparaginyl beta-hydroxylase domain-containing protein [Streptomyces sp. NBC_01750]WSD37543.1 aspartyl/asparaginyl beta-hydroxylase domain-containing protein [Streptomyces sp. NBC_01750]